MEERKQPIIIGVIGMDDHAPEEPLTDKALMEAEDVGRLVASRGGIIITGGRGGVMEAASKGANLAGGIVVGLLPSNSKTEANRYVNVPIATGIGGIRNILTVRAADAVIMISGSNGTLNELTVAYGLKPIIVIEGTGGWSDLVRSFALKGKHLDKRSRAEILFAQSAADAVDMAFAMATPFPPIDAEFA